MTPSGSLVVSITTPQGSGDTEQSSLRTVPSDSAVTERDLGRDIDRLADELRTYDHARGLENQDVVDNVRALREELRDLADFLHRTPSPPSPVVIPSERVETPIPRRIVQMADASVGRGTSISSGQHFLPLPPATPTSLSRATSNASSINSYLSSHHSDDDVFDEELTYIHSPQFWDHEVDVDDASIDSDSSTTSGSTSLGPSSQESPAEYPPEARAPSIPYEPFVPRESPIPRESPVPRGSPVPRESPTPRTASEASTIRPSVDLLRSIGNIRDQLQALESGQDTAHTLLRSLLGRPEDPTAELADRLRRIEDLVQALVDQRHTRGPEIVQDVPVAPFEPATSIEPEGSVSDSDSLGNLGSLLGRLTRDGPFMPVPVAARRGPTMVQQLDEILSSAHQMPVVSIDQPPNVDPFTYRPVERGRRVRSESPGSFSLPARPSTYPLPYSGVQPVHRPPIRRGVPSEVGRTTISLEPPPQPPVSTQVQAPQEPERQRPAQPSGHSFPIPAPVMVSQRLTYY